MGLGRHTSSSWGGLSTWPEYNDLLPTLQWPLKYYNIHFNTVEIRSKNCTVTLFFTSFALELCVFCILQCTGLKLWKCSIDYHLSSRTRNTTQINKKNAVSSFIITSIGWKQNFLNCCQSNYHKQNLWIIYASLKCLHQPKHRRQCKNEFHPLLSWKIHKICSTSKMFVGVFI